MVDYVIDIETDGIDATKIHCMSVHDSRTNKITTFTTYADMQMFFASVTRMDRIIGHNFIRYDAPIIERILDLTIPCNIVDTLAISWYLWPYKGKHGLAQWGEQIGIAKPEVEDWQEACIETYTNRCEEDVRINLEVWKREISYLNFLYNDKPEVLIRYLAHKMRCAQLAERSKWKLDVDAAQSLLESMEKEYAESESILMSAMPRVPKIAKRKRPAKPYKKDGTLSATGEKWQALCDERGLDFAHDQEVEIVVGFEPPNAGSTLQIKNWLYSLGWEPQTFEYARFDPNIQAKGGVPQVKLKSGDMCPSVLKLIDDNPAVAALETIMLIKHRISTVKGFLKNADANGYLVAAIGGLTNTLRFKHRVCVNIPSVRKPYGKEIRALLTCEEGSVLCGSDMSSLEDRTKQHYMYDHDPEFVADMMTPDFDPHLDLALSSGALKPEQVDEYKAGNHTPEVTQIRHAYKGGNYACTYGAGVKTLSRQLTISEKEAAKIHKAYWKRNWSLKKIAKEQITRRAGKDAMWLYNPVSRLWYSLRSDKDIFSTLNQGTGVYCFDLWLKLILSQRPQITGQFHDEIILEIKDNERQEIRDLLKTCINKVNDMLKLNRDLDCDIQFGNNYSNIH